MIHHDRRHHACGRNILRTNIIISCMIVLSLKNTILRVDFSFFAVLAMFFCFDSGSGVCTLFSCIFHEFGHLLALLMFSVPINELYLYGGGIRITAPLSSLDKPRRVIVLLAGCLFNFMLAVVFGSLRMYLPMTINIMLAVLNLMPLRCLDGGQLIMLICDSAGISAGKWLMSAQLMSIVVTSFLLLRYDIRPDITFAVFIVYQLLINLSNLIIYKNNY